MKKITVSEPFIVAQSTTEPILFGGYQDPTIRCNEDGVLYVRFSGRRDCHETFGMEHLNPIYCSKDCGETWEPVTDEREWICVPDFKLPNGDHLLPKEPTIVKDLPKAFPNVTEDRKNIIGICSEGTAYTVDEIAPLMGDKIPKSFCFDRIPAGSDKVIREEAAIHWENMPVTLFTDRTPSYFSRMFPHTPRADKNGILYMNVHGPYIKEDGTAGSRRYCTHLLRSDDLGRNWSYVSTIPYLEEYNDPNCIDIEGFTESTMQIMDDGSLVLLMRSGSLHPFKQGDQNHPAPKIYYAKSYDSGKTWGIVKPFYDYGVRPFMVKLGCGALLMTSGRPGVYIRASFDPAGEQWEDVIPILKVPQKDIYTAYYEYTCSNNDLCVYDDHTAFLTYSDFTGTAPDGKRAKSILVRKITISD